MLNYNGYPGINNYNSIGTGVPVLGGTANPTMNVYGASAINNSFSGSVLTVLVSGEDEVKNYPVAAGTTVMLLDFNGSKFWLKTTDTNGLPQPVRTFEFSESTPKAEIQNVTVSREEFDELSKKMDRLLAELGGSSNEQ